MLWHRQVIFKSKGDNLSSSVEIVSKNTIPIWHLAHAIYMFVVNFDALVPGSDVQIERRHVGFLC